MKIWYLKSKGRCSIYFFPLTWNKLLALFDHNDICTIEHFSGVGDGNSFYMTWYATSPEFMPMKQAMRLHDFKRLVKEFVKWPHEYKLMIGDVGIERGITGGIIFTADENRLNQVIEKLKTHKNHLQLSNENKLISIGKTGKIKVEGEFNKPEDLLDHVYDELMKKESPDYFKFMAALAAAPFE